MCTIYASMHQCINAPRTHAPNAHISSLSSLRGSYVLHTPLKYHRLSPRVPRSLFPVLCSLFPVSVSRFPFDSLFVFKLSCCLVSLSPCLCPRFPCLRFPVPSQAGRGAPLDPRRPRRAASDDLNGRPPSSLSTRSRGGGKMATTTTATTTMMGVRAAARTVGAARRGAGTWRKVASGRTRRLPKRWIASDPPP